MSADVIWLCPRRDEAEDLDIDLHTAIDVAVRDLQEIKTLWGSEQALQRLAECQSMLQKVRALS